jgi:AcrR family transcriptional regulator
LTRGAIYAHFESRDDLLRGALEYYREHIPSFDVPGARSVRELLLEQTRARLALVESTEEGWLAIHRLQELNAERGRTDPAVREIVAKWDESRRAVLAARITEVAGEAGERLVIDAELLAAQAIEVAMVFMSSQYARPELNLHHAALGAVAALVDAALGEPPQAKGRTT